MKDPIQDAASLLRAFERALGKVDPSRQVCIASADDRTAEPLRDAAQRRGFQTAVLPLPDHPSAWKELLGAFPRTGLLALAHLQPCVYASYRSVADIAADRGITLLRPAFDYDPVLEDPLFEGICTRLSNATPWNLDFWRSRKSYGVFQLLVEAAELPGDFVEFGCYRGYSACFAAETLRTLGAASRKIHLFDTWQGMPAQSGDWDNCYHQGDFSDTSLEAVQKVHKPWADLFEYVPGDIVQTVVDAPARPLAYIRIDVDLFHPTRAILQHAFPRLVPRGLVYLDDYATRETVGERLAVDEFLSSRPERVQMGYGDRPFLRKRAD